MKKTLIILSLLLSPVFSAGAAGNNDLKTAIDAIDANVVFMRHAHLI